MMNPIEQAEWNSLEAQIQKSRRQVEANATNVHRNPNSTARSKQAALTQDLGHHADIAQARARQAELCNPERKSDPRIKEQGWSG